MKLPDYAPDIPKSLWGRSGDSGSFATESFGTMDKRRVVISAKV